MEASVANEQRCTSICLLRRSCQHTPPLLVQRALVLGASSQEAEGRAGTARSQDSVIRMADVMHAQPVVIAPASFVWKPVLPTSSAVQASAFCSNVVSIHPPSGATRTSIGACSQEAEGRAGKASSADSAIRRVGVMHVPPAVAILAPFVWKPVSPTSSTAQASNFRAQVVSIRPPSGATRISIGGLQSRSRRTGRESTLSRLDHL